MPPAAWAAVLAALAVAAGLVAAIVSAITSGVQTTEVRVDTLTREMHGLRSDYRQHLYREHCTLDPDIAYCAPPRLVTDGRGER